MLRYLSTSGKEPTPCQCRGDLKGPPRRPPITMNVFPFRQEEPQSANPAFSNARCALLFQSSVCRYSRCSPVSRNRYVTSAATASVPYPCAQQSRRPMLIPSPPPRAPPPPHPPHPLVILECQGSQRLLDRQPLDAVVLLVVVRYVAPGGPHQVVVHPLMDSHTFPREPVLHTAA